MYLRRVRVAGCGLAAALAHLSTVIMSPTSAAHKLATFFFGFGNFRVFNINSRRGTGEEWQEGATRSQNLNIQPSSVLC
jgi:hypothetical protein